MATTNKKKKNALDDVNSGIIFPSILSKDMTDRIKAAQNDDIAPVRTVRKETTSFYDDWAPIRTVGTLSKDDKKKKERKWFNQGLFEDGWQAGDIAKTILGTATDLDQNAKAGMLGIGEKVVDAGAYVVGGIAGLRGNDKLKQKAKDFIQKDLYDEHKLASNPIIQSNPFASVSHILGLDADETSVFGEEIDNLAYSGGQLAGTVALSGVGVPWFVTTGVTGFGAGVEESFNEGGNYIDAGVYGGITAGAEVLTEKLSGGIKFGGKTLDDALLKPLTKQISNKIARTLVNYGIDAAGEGAEEVISEVASNVGKKLTTEDEKTWREILISKEAFEGYMNAAIGGVLMGGGVNVGKLGQSFATGRDYSTGLTDNEQKVVDAEVQKRIAEQETGDKKLTKKEKSEIEQQVKTQLERGEISIDSIESALGGETYNSYKSVLEQEEALKKAYEEAGNKTEDGLNYIEKDAQKKAYDDAKAKYEEFQKTSNKEQLKEQLSKEVDELTQSDTFLRESYNEKARKGQAFEADLTKYKNKEQQAIIQKAIDSKILNNTRRTHEFVDMISKIAADKGVSFDFTNNEKLKESGFAVDGATVNGYVQGNNISLNIQSAKSLNKVVGHEITHVLEGTELYSELQTVVKQYAETKGEYATRLEALQELYKDVEDANVENELTADLIGDYLFTDEQFVNNLSTKNPNIFKKIYEEIKYLVKVATAGTKEAKELERIKRVFEKAYKQSTENTSSERKYSLVKDSKGNNVVLLNEDIFDGKLDTEKPHDYIADYIATEVGNSFKIIESGRSVYIGQDLPTEFTQSKYTQRIRKNRPDLLNAKNQTVQNLRDIVEIATDRKWEKNTKTKHNIDAKYGFYKYTTRFAVKKKNGNATGYEATLVIRNDANGKKYLYDITNIKKTGTLQLASTSQGSHGHVGGMKPPQGNPVNGSVPQNQGNSTPNKGNLTQNSLSRDSDGNSVNENMQLYMKDTKAVDADGALMKVYHGTVREFYTFDRSYANAEGNMGKGFYFTNNVNDVDENYANENGADLTNKIEREADLLDGMDEYEDMDHDEIVAMLREKYITSGEPIKHECYLNITKPCYIGRYNGKPETYLFDDVSDEYDIDDFEDEDEYYYAIEEMAEEYVESAIDAVESNIEFWDDSIVENIRGILHEAIAEGGIRAEDLRKRLDDLYIEDADGELVSSEVLRIIIESQGYDGVIDSTVSQKFPGMHLSKDTVHYIVFDSKQAKLTSNQNPTTNPDIRRSLSRKNEDIAPIGKYNVYGKDIALDAPIRSDIPKSAITDAPIRSDVKQQNDWDEDDEIFGTYSEDNVESPFENRDIKDVGRRNVNAYQYDNPEVKPYFQFEAEVMLWDLQHSTKGERIQTGSYDTGQDWTGVKRATSPEIETLLDDYGYSYAEIEKGLNAIIKDNGAENIAVAKRIEFILDERLRNGYTDFTTGDQIEPNQEYLDLFKTIPAAEDIAPVRQDVAKETPAEDIAPVKEPKTDEEIARVLDIEPKTAQQKGRRKVAVLAANILDKGLVFENLSLKTRNRELQSKYQAIKNAESSAQWLIGNGDAENGVKSLDTIREEVGNTGLTREFYEYMYHKHNVDRMSLADRYENMENKPVFGKHVTADISQKIVEQFESQHPEFTTFANEVYTYNRYLRQQLVDNGVISQETADLWEEMYPHYIPTRRVDSKGLNINVPLDSRRTGINAPIKRAIGGNTDILPLFDTMGMRTLQTYKATAKNSFGVELKNTLGSVLDSKNASVDEVIETLDTQDELLQKGKNGGLPSFTVFENGERVTFEITEEMYDAMKPAEGLLSMTFKPTNFVSNLHRGLLTEYNPVFMLTNGIKDVQDVLINSQHPVRTYRKLPEAYAQIAKKGYWYNEYMKNGGGSNSYFDNDTNTFKTSNKGIGKVLSKPPFSTISALNNFIEMAPRLAEYIASREAGQSKETAMLDAARVTTNFKAGGDLTKFLNRNGATFLNASVQGAMQQVRNIREAQVNGVKGWAMLATKFAIAGVPAMILNGLIWDDDEEYEELSDYVKQNYHILWKTDDGQFIRIPKGRTVAVIEDAMKQVVNLSKGNDEADLRSFLELVITNLAPNNPIENNILAPIMQVKNNETWYGEDMVPTRLQDLPKAEQYDESTDALSRKLGEALNVSPIKINYLLDQYSGGVGDMVLPMFTPQAESGNDRKIGALIAPLKNKFVTDGVINNQNVADFYDMSDELTTNAKMSTATDKDILMNKYMNSVSGQMSELYKRKREIQNSDMKNSTKYDMVRAVQEQIVELSKEGLNNYSKVKINGNYATVGGLQYKKNDNGEWQKLTDELIEKQEEMTRLLNISPSEFWSADEESMEAYNWAYQNPEKHTFSKSITDDVVQYRAYASDLYNIKADKDSYGKSISGTRKKKVASYINGLDIPDEAKYILFKSEYPSDDSHNMDIINYLNDRDDISAEEMRTILLELDFKVDEEGYITW